MYGSIQNSPESLLISKIALGSGGVVPLSPILNSGMRLARDCYSLSEVSVLSSLYILYELI